MYNDGKCIYNYKQFLQWKQNKLYMSFILSNDNVGIVLSDFLQLEECNDVYKVISDIMAQL